MGTRRLECVACASKKKKFVGAGVVGWVVRLVQSILGFYDGNEGGIQLTSYQVNCVKCA